MRRLILPFGAVLIASGCGFNAVHPDPLAVLRQNQKAMFDLRGYQATCYTSYEVNGPKQARKWFELSTLRAEKPHWLKYESWRSKSALDSQPAEPPTAVYACDGRRSIMQSGRTYRVEQGTDTEHVGAVLDPWNGFYDKSKPTLISDGDLRNLDGGADADYRGHAIEDNVLCDRIEIHKKLPYSGSTIQSHETYFIGVADHLIHRFVSDESFGNKGHLISDSRVRHIVLNQAENPTVYRYEPPSGVTLATAVRRDPKG